jgi:hypothetical protein
MQLENHKLYSNLRDVHFFHLEGSRLRLNW